MRNKTTIKVYNGYGHRHNLVVYGHVYKNRATSKRPFGKSVWANIIHLFKLFIVKPYPAADVMLTFQGKIISSKAEEDGFFKFNWEADTEVEAGWHQVDVAAYDADGHEIAVTKGSIYVSSVTQYAFVSDIDDTVLISYSATVFRRLREMLIKSPIRRKLFEESATWYNLLAYSETTEQKPNPFFYVSSSEWNLYSNLELTFKHHKLPEGTFLLSHLKRWYELFSTGKTNHEGKLHRIERVMKVFSNQRFILIGDNTQRDPIIYAKIVSRYPGRIKAIYIRDMRRRKKDMTIKILEDISHQGVLTCFFSTAAQAIKHGKEIGLINNYN